MEPKMMIMVGVVFFGGIFAYLLFMIFFPEWVGITGKKALEDQRAQRGGPVGSPGIIDKMHDETKNKDEESP